MRRTESLAAHSAGEGSSHSPSQARPLCGTHGRGCCLLISETSQPSRASATGINLLPRPIDPHPLTCSPPGLVLLTPPVLTQPFRSQIRRIDRALSGPTFSAIRKLILPESLHVLVLTPPLVMAATAPGKPWHIPEGGRGQSSGTQVVQSNRTRTGVEGRMAEEAGMVRKVLPKCFSTGSVSRKRNGHMEGVLARSCSALTENILSPSTDLASDRPRVMSQRQAPE